jgi:hypothetical protein
VDQSSDGRCLWEAGVELSPNAIHRAARIEFLPAPRRDDAIPQAEVVGDGLPVADPEQVEVALYNRTRIAHLEYHCYDDGVGGCCPCGWMVVTICCNHELQLPHWDTK